MVAMAAAKRTHMNTSNTMGAPIVIHPNYLYFPFFAHLPSFTFCFILSAARSCFLCIFQRHAFSRFGFTHFSHRLHNTPLYMLYGAGSCTFKKTTKNWVRYCDGINFKLNKSHKCERIQFILFPLPHSLCSILERKSFPSLPRSVCVCVSHSTLCVPHGFLLIFLFLSLALLFARYVCLSVCLYITQFFCYGNDGNVFFPYLFQQTFVVAAVVQLMVFG